VSSDSDVLYQPVLFAPFTLRWLRSFWQGYAGKNFARHQRCAGIRTVMITDLSLVEPETADNMTYGLRLFKP